MTNVIVIESINDPVFRLASDMENNIFAIRNLALAVMHLANDSLNANSSVQRALYQISCEIDRQAEEMSKRQEELFHLTHPNRAEFERGPIQ